LLIDYFSKNKAKSAMFTLNCRGRLLVIDTPVVMSIINITPDSFYSGSRKNNIDEILSQAEKMIAEGATILDIGGQSTRPGSKALTASEELDRVLAGIQAVRSNFKEAYISIDTYHATVAEQAVSAGADIVNDISAGNLDELMITTVGRLNVPYICMHMQGTPQTMQQNPQYKNVTLDVLDFFIEKQEQCRLAGINDVIIDPGFGFGKTMAHNFELLKNLKAFDILKKPLLAGLSRKGTIYKTLGITAEEALNGTTVLNTIALMNGAKILRVHDVKEAVEAVKLLNQFDN
jgi:dihydropteroate synthase